MNVSLPDRILVAIDYGPVSESALATAALLAARLSATLHVVHASAVAVPEQGHASTQGPSHNLYDLTRQSAETELADFVNSTLKANGLEWEAEVLFGPAERELLPYAARLGASWLVVGGQHKHGLPRALLGSVAEYLLRHSPIPVLIVPSSQ